MEGLQPRLWAVAPDVRDAGTTRAYDRWFARHRPRPLTDLRVPVPRVRPATGQEEEGVGEGEEEVRVEEVAEEVRVEEVTEEVGVEEVEGTGDGDTRDEETDTEGSSEDSSEEDTDSEEETDSEDSSEEETGDARDGTGDDGGDGIGDGGGDVGGGIGGAMGGDIDVGEVGDDAGGEGIGETGGEMPVMDIDEAPLVPPEEIPESAQLAHPEVDSVERIKRLQMELEER